MGRRMRPVYGAPPSAVSQQQVASEDAARRFARRRLMSGLAGGLRGYNPEGGFLENLIGGVSGSLGGTLQANQMQHEEERQSIKDQGEQQRYQEQQARLNASLGIDQAQLDLARQREARLSSEPANGPNIGATPWYEALPDDDPRKAQYRADATRAPLGAAGGGPTAMQRNVKFLEGLGYDTEDALSIVQRMFPTETTGTIYDELRGVTLPTKGSRTPKPPKRRVAAEPSHGKPKASDFFK